MQLPTFRAWLNGVEIQKPQGIIVGRFESREYIPVALHNMPWFKVIADNLPTESQKIYFRLEVNNHFVEFLTDYREYIVNTITIDSLQHNLKEFRFVRISDLVEVYV